MTSHHCRQQCTWLDLFIRMLRMHSRQFVSLIVMYGTAFFCMCRYEQLCYHQWWLLQYSERKVRLLYWLNAYVAVAGCAAVQANDSPVTYTAVQANDSSVTYMLESIKFIGQLFLVCRNELTFLCRQQCTWLDLFARIMRPLCRIVNELYDCFFVSFMHINSYAAVSGGGYNTANGMYVSSMWLYARIAVTNCLIDQHEWQSSHAKSPRKHFIM